MRFLIYFSFFFFFTFFFFFENHYTLTNKKCAHRNATRFHVRLHNTLWPYFSIVTVYFLGKWCFKLFRLGSSERVLSSHPLSQRSTTLLGRAVIDYLYLYKYEIVCLSVCLFAFFSAISKPIGIPFGTKLLLTLGKF